MRSTTASVALVLLAALAGFSGARFPAARALPGPAPRPCPPRAVQQCYEAARNNVALRRPAGTPTGC
jgi:hypothetical protein